MPAKKKLRRKVAPAKVKSVDPPAEPKPSIDAPVEEPNLPIDHPEPETKELPPLLADQAEPTDDEPEVDELPPLLADQVESEEEDQTFLIDSTSQLFTPPAFDEEPEDQDLFLDGHEVPEPTSERKTYSRAVTKSRARKIRLTRSLYVLQKKEDGKFYEKELVGGKDYLVENYRIKGLCATFELRGFKFKCLKSWIN